MQLAIMEKGGRRMTYIRYGVGTGTSEGTTIWADHIMWTNVASPRQMIEEEEE